MATNLLRKPHMPAGLKKPVTLVAAVVLMALGLTLACRAPERLGFLQRLEWMTYDWRVQLAANPSAPADSRLALVYLDDDSLALLNERRGYRWPWPRGVYAEALRELQAQDAAGVAFDIRFFELHKENPESDRAFAEQLRASGNVVLATMGEGAGRGDWLALPPAALFATNAAALGHITSDRDADGVMRQTFAYRDDPQFGRVWHLALVLGARALGLDLGRAEIHPDRIVLRGPGVERVIPVDERGRFPIDWSLAKNDFRVTQQSIHELLKIEVPDSRSGTRRATPARFKDKLVVIGSVGSGSNIADHGSTPLEKDSFLVSSHWNVLNSLLGGRFVRRSGSGTDLLLVALLGIAAGAAALRLEVRRSTALLAVCAAAYFAVCAVCYSRQRLWLPVAMPLLTALAAHVAVVSWRAFFESRERARLHAVFAKVVAPEVAAELLRLTELRLGGEHREVTVFFADIRGFTEISNLRHEEALAHARLLKLDPAATRACLDEQAAGLLNTVNLYLKTVSDLVKQQRGTLDKYIGDCVMAFWGAPVASDTHALDAVRTALAAQRAVHTLNRERDEENRRREAGNVNRLADGLPPLPPLPLLSLGTGINTGSVIAGLMGSEDHVLNYTVFGREVNLASRLESASGQGRILIGEETFRALQRLDPALAATCVAQAPARLKGFDEPVQCHEVPWREPGDTEQFAVNETRSFSRAGETRFQIRPSDISRSQDRPHNSNLPPAPPNL
ncbi:MAG: adenylate/guanylate cyclase domain-containing protein [Limisphaerales bacterium]